MILFKIIPLYIFNNVFQLKKRKMQVFIYKKIFM